MHEEIDNQAQPPAAATRFLRWFLRPDLLEEVEGDLHEKYMDKLEGTTSTKANWQYWYQVLQYLRPFAIRQFHLLPKINPDMFRSHFKVTFRNLWSQKFHSIINILGLGLSLCVVFLILLWVRDEWNVDKFHLNADQLFRVKRTIPLEGQALDVYRGISYPLLKTSVEEIPGVRAYIPIGYSHEDHLQVGEEVLRTKGTFANASYLEGFSFPLLQGDAKQLDDRKDAVAISESLALRFFGNDWRTEAMGSTLHIHDNGDFSIQAIYADFPAGSSLQNDFLYSLQAHLDDNEWLMEWTNNGMQGVVLLQENANPAIVQSTMDALFKEHQEGDLKEGIILQKFHEDYLFGQYDNKARVAGGRIEYVRIFVVAAVFLLIISCINFINLSTARATKRAREVGVRKTIGAGKKSLVSQFLIESFVITVFAVILSVAMTVILFPFAESLTGKDFAISFGDPYLYIAVIGITVITALLAGFYPALVLSNFKPINMLSSKQEKRGGLSLRRGLVVLQFVLSLLLIVSALVVSQQVNHIMNAHLGMQKENLLSIHQDELITNKYDVLKRELESKESVAGVTVAGPTPHQMLASTSGVNWTGKRPDQENVEFSILWTAHDFPEMFEIPMAAGRFYRKDEVGDTTRIVVNEKALEIMGLEGDPIGQTIEWWGDPRQIIGVLQDFYNQSFYEQISPSAFLLDPDNAGSLFVKAKAGQVAACITDVKSVFREVVPEVPLHFTFVDDQIQSQYQSEIVTGKLANLFAIISIFVSCLGLLGLITFVAQQKTKEIGIRKVLGASLPSLVGLLSREFILLVLLAFMVASPISYLVLVQWLDRFANHVQINWLLLFGITGLGAMVITLITIGFQSVKSALANPMESLRTE